MFKALSTKSRGDDAETRALNYLSRQGLRLAERNYRVARGPHARGGEVDLIMRAPDGTLVFVEVRARSDPSHGGAAASISPAKQRRIIFAAGHYLRTLRITPPCRFDVVAIEADRIDWLPGAFDTHTAWPTPGD